MGSGYKNFTAGAVLTASDVNNYLMEQGVMYFATTAARDAALTAEDGMVAYIGSNDASEGLYTYNGTAWRKGPGWNAPWGVMGYVINTTLSQGANTETDLPGLTITFTAVANRLYELKASVVGYTSVAGDRIAVGIKEGSTTLQTGIMGQTLASNGEVVPVYLISTFSAGSHTVKLTGRRDSGTGTTTFVAGSTIPAVFTVSDIGPAGAPA
jgi:hypothetical protein